MCACVVYVFGAIFRRSGLYACTILNLRSSGNDPLSLCKHAHVPKHTHTHTTSVRFMCVLANIHTAIQDALSQSSHSLSFSGTCVVCASLIYIYV